MGDLDGAIREHLELKRRRGADPAEVAREEQEALAPVTRGHAIVVPEDLERAERHGPPSGWPPPPPGSGPRPSLGGPSRTFHPVGAASGPRRAASSGAAMA